MNYRLKDRAEKNLKYQLVDKRASLKEMRGEGNAILFLTF